MLERSPSINALKQDFSESISNQQIAEAFLLYFGATFFKKNLSLNSYQLFDRELIIKCPKEEIVYNLNNYYLSSIYRAFEERIGRSGVKISIVLDPSVRPEFNINNIESDISNALKESVKGSGFNSLPVHNKDMNDNFGYKQDFSKHGNVIFSDFHPKGIKKPSVSFSNFVSDESNEAALFLSKSFCGLEEDMIYNTNNLLFIYGDVGFGKTHLARSIYHSVNESNRNSSIYFSSESFTSEFIKSLNTRTVQDFKEKITCKDFIIIDDIHSLVERKRTMMELSRIICNAYDIGKKIIITSTQKPDILDQRLHSLVLSGSYAKISNPTTHIKEQILHNLIKENNVPIYSEEIEFLAKNVIGGIRELKGVFNRLSVASSFNNSPMTISRIKNTVEDLLIESNNPTIVKSSDTSYYIKKAICGFLNMDMKKLVSKGRTKEVVYGRNLGMYLCRHDLKMSFQEIASLFQRNSHNAVMTGVKSIEKNISRDAVKEDLDSIRRIIARSKLRY